MFGRATAKVSGSDDDGFRHAELVIVTVSDDGAVAPLNAIPLDGMNALPCAVWGTDGRWAAFGGADALWVVDTMTDEIRRLPGYNPHELEWRPGTDELAIAGHRPVNYISDAPIDLYSAGTGEIRTLSDVEAANITWSPDGTTIAFTHGEDQPDSGIWLVAADGTNRRQLTTATGDVLHGIGVVWSPRGDLIAYQRVCQEHPHGEDGALMPSCGEQHEVVLVTATGDAANPTGSEVVIAPPQPKEQTDRSGGSRTASPGHRMAPSSCTRRGANRPPPASSLYPSTPTRCPSSSTVKSRQVRTRVHRGCPPNSGVGPEAESKKTRG